MDRVVTTLANAALAVVLRRLQAGVLDLTMPDGSRHRFVGREPGPHATVRVNDAEWPRTLVSGGSTALGEGYMNGAWETDDLNAVLALGTANAKANRVVDFLVPLRTLFDPPRDNDPEVSKANIEYHYDLGNDFYSLWLDQSMTYSAACFACDDECLESAQRRKWDRVLDLLQPATRDRILEIGCGWGGFAIHAAKTAGCRVTGLTLSNEQAALARRRVAEEGLEGRVDIRIRDYRHETGRYGGVASIEMFEAVGEKWWPTYFRAVRNALRPGAAAALQVITIDDAGYDVYRRRPDFTQRYIFPGGMLPSPAVFVREAGRAGLRAGEPAFFGNDYARTLTRWAERFETALPEVRRLGYDERFIRMWRYYLAYCKAGFEAGNVNVMQVRLEV